ncbi:carbohydrate binding domain containing protein [Holotrichia oblita]|uniref:Carbohydrate binding domain containing protein n=2 Tax=Holotrichia oblita TaxID=644536 RepID=A0ACB9T249_HOLOL|nr:carbohydrate binding domain containing protein [Holotrichia oblita]KAI4460889.1 carbohydrate binding domain containing protein [Holotrichia oblita]
MATTESHHPEPPSVKKVSPTKFRVIHTYVRNPDREVDNLLAEVAVTEGLQVSNFVVASAIETNRESLCIHYSQELDQLAAGYTDGVVRFYKANTMELVQSLSDDDILESPAPVTNIKHRPLSKNYPATDTIVCTYANGCVKCWNYSFCQCVYTIKEKRQTYGIAYHPRLPKFVTCGDDCKVYMYDEENRVQERIFSGSNTPGVLDGHTSRVFAACFNPRSNHELITGGWDNVIQFWDARQPFAIRHISGIHICGDGLDIHPKGTEALGTINKLPGAVYSIALGPTKKPRDTGPQKKSKQAPAKMDVSLNLPKLAIRNKIIITSINKWTKNMKKPPTSGT